MSSDGSMSTELFTIDVTDVITIAAFTLDDNSLAEGDTATLTARLEEDSLIVPAVLALHHGGGLIRFSRTELVFGPGELEATAVVTAINNNLADANVRSATISIVSRDADVSPAPRILRLSIEPDNAATITAEPERLTLDEGQTQDVIFTVTPPLAQPAVITAAPSDEGQITLNKRRLTVAAGRTTATFTVTADDDNIDEDERVYTIDLNVEGHAMLTTNRIAVTVPANDRRAANPRDVDTVGGSGGRVNENSPAGAPVGILVEADYATDYSLSDDAGGRFVINASGFVSVNDGSRLNYEDATAHSITVEAGNNFAETASITLTIELINVDEITLRDIDDATRNLAQALAGAEVIGMTLEAVHADGEPITRWELPGDSPFELTRSNNSSTQGLRIKADAGDLSSRVGTTVSLSVTARTQHDVITESFTILFTEQDPAPLLVGELMDTDNAADEVAENSLADATVGITIQAANADAYTLTDNAGGRFAIDRDSGLVTVANGSLLNFEDATSHSIIALASNPHSSRSMRFAIAVTGVNEFDLGPVTDSDSADNELPENASASSYTGITLSATDRDAGAVVTYALIDSNGGLFAVDGDSGIVTLRGQLDYESSTQHAITARAMSSDGSAPTMLSLTIAVINVDEITLRDSDGASNLAQALAGAEVRGMTLEAVHADGEPITRWELPGDSPFELTRDNDNSTQGLRIKAGAGDLSSRIGVALSLNVIARTEYDEATESFIIRFTERDPVSVLIGELEDVDDAANEVAENSLNGSMVGITIQAENSTNYTLIDDAGGRFAIDGDSGLVTVADGGLLNFEEDTSHSINVEASNAEDSRSMRFAIAVTGVNEFDLGPVTDSDPADNELPENAPASSYTGITLSAADRDAGAVVTYALIDSNGGLFAVDRDSGRVTLRGSLDYERSARHAIIAQAMSSDGSAPTTAAFTIDVTDVITIAVVSLDDDSLAEGDMTILTARLEKDSLIAPATLTLSHNGGLIRFSDPELVFGPGKTEAAIVVTARDNGRADASARAAAIAIVSQDADIDPSPDILSLSIEPDNEAAITPQPARLTISEGETQDVVFTVAPPLAQPAIITATPSDAEQITLNSTQLTVAAGQTRVTLSVAAVDDDIEENELDYTIDLNVEGHATLTTNRIAVTVPANDRRVANPRDVDTVGGIGGIVVENSPAGAPVGILIEADHATDYDLSDNAGGRFAISGTGLVTVADGSRLNYEDAKAHSITVEASNSFAETVSIILTVSLVNADEITLSDTDGRNDLVQASTGAEVRGMTLEAVHADGEPIVRWYLPEDSPFELTQPADSSTQGLRIKADADNLSSRIDTAISLSVAARTEYDATTESFTISFIAREPVLVGELMDTDSADNEVAENSLADATVGITIRAENATNYALIDDAGGRFAIDGDSGLVTVADGSLLNFEEDTSHSINVEASNAHSSRSKPFAIMVTDVNEPVSDISDSDNLADEIREDALPGSRTGVTLSATDEDGGAIVTYALSDSNGGLFAVDRDSGRVTLRGRLNYERSTRHTITARAMSSDGSAPTMLSLAIAVINVDEITLRDLDEATRNLALASAGAEVIGMTLEAVHADGEAITRWELPGDSPFELTRDNDSSTQGLRIKTDAENLSSGSLSLNVIARTQYDVATETFIIRLTEQDPVRLLVGELIDIDGAVNVASENAPKGRIVGITIRAANATNYTLIDDAGGSFAIDGDSGLVTVADSGPLNYEEESFHTITVEASNAHSSRSRPFTIMLLDADDPVGDVSDSDLGLDEIREDAVPGSYTGITLSATDEDRGAAITYILVDSDNDRFAVDRDSGRVTLRGQLNYERSTQHTIAARARSNRVSSPTTRTFTVAVINVNEITLIDIDERSNLTHASAGVVVPGVMLMASHADGEPITAWELPDDSPFELTQPADSSTQSLRIKDVPNLRSYIGGSINLNVVARTEYDVTTEPFTIRFTERDPFFIFIGPVEDIDLKNSNIVDENSPMDTYAGIIVSAVNATNYTLVDDATGRFTIDSRTQEVLVADGSLINYEVSTVHTIVVEASNAYDSRTGSLFIEVRNVPEPISEISDSDFDLADEIREDAIPGSYTGITLSAIDEDFNDTVTYRLLDSGGGLFIADTDTGIVTLRGMLDYERSIRHTIIAQALSSDDSMATATFTVAVINVDEIALSDTDERENLVRAAAGSEARGLTLEAAHDDGVPIVSWELSPDTPFEITRDDGSSTQNLRIKADAEGLTPLIDTTISLSVIARTQHDVTTEAFIIGFTEQEPVLPAFVTTAILTLADDSLAEGDTTTLSVRLENPLTAAATLTLIYDDLISLSGEELAIARGETTAAVIVAAIDNNLADASSRAAAITVTGQSDNLSSVIPDNVELSVERDNEAAIAVEPGRFAFDEGQTREVVFTISPPLAQRATITAAIPLDDRQISLSATQLEVAAEQARTTLDVTAVDDELRELRTVSTISISVIGHARPETNRVIVTVLESDQPVSTPRDIDAIAGEDGEVAENSPVGTLVGITVRADYATTYTLSDDAGGLFAIDPQSGTVTVALDALDYEAFSSHRITVEASNAINRETATFTIFVTDVPEPIKYLIDIDPSPDEIGRGARAGAPAGITAWAVDPDRGSAIIYSLVEDSTGLFVIGRQDGVVSLASENYRLGQDYLIEVQARSNDSSITAQFIIGTAEPVLIRVDPKTPTAPEGTSQVITFSFIEMDLKLVSLSAGRSHNCGITPDGRTVCWGDNGDDQSAPSTTRELIAIGAGGRHSCGITAGNDAVCWGDNFFGQAEPPAGEFSALSAGNYHNCAIAANDDLVCWGDNLFRQSRMPPAGRFIAVSAGGSHSCGITAANDAVCWGTDLFGSTTPPPGRKFIAVGVGDAHSCGITLDNDLVCWGSAGEKQSMPPAGEFIAVSSGNSHNCAITIGRDLICWGDDSYRQSESPAGKFIAVSAGASHNCAITASNDVVCWGSDLSGQIMPPQIIPLATEAVTITAMVSVADREQISISANQAVIPVGATRTTLTVTVTDDDAEEPDADHLVELGVEGHARLDTDRVTVTAPANDRRVTDLNDIDDTEGEDGADGAVAENSPIGAPVGITVQAANATSYTLTDDADGRFAISATGLVTVADGERLNYEEDTSHSITVQAGNRFAETASTTLGIQVVNVNEITLRDLDSRNNFVHASTGAVAIGITLEAVHADGFPISGWELPSDSPFEITQTDNSSTQGIRIKADAENLRSYINTAASLRIIARASYDEAAMISTVRFTAQEPFFVGEIEDTDGEAGGMVAENSPIGTPVGITVRATGASTYTLSDDADGRFTVSSTGFVTVLDGGKLDYEDATSHSITAQASSIIDSRSMRFTVYVIDVDEFALGPVTDSDPVDNELPENAPASSYTGITLSATDEDGSAIVTYRLLDSNDGLFLADTNTGVVSLRAQLDYERSSRHTIIAQAMSSAGSAPTTATFTIAVTDVNEPVGPITDIDPADNEIAKGARASSAIGITAFAEDPEGSTVVYSLNPVSDHLLFAIDEDLGVVTLASDDYRRNRTYAIVVEALSGDGSSSTQRFVISPAFRMITTATATLADDSLAEGDTTTLSVSLDNPLVAAATITLSHDDLITLSSTELVFARGETEVAVAVAAIDNNMANAATRAAAIALANRSTRINLATEEIGLEIERDDEAAIAVIPTQLTLNEGRTAEVVFTVSPALAQAATITATPSDEGQIALSSTQLTVAAGQARSVLSVTAVNDMLDEEELSYTIDLRVVGHARFEPGQSEITVTVLPARDPAGRIRLRIRVYLEGALE